jgi:acetyltransferase-like isoleucine patch superfamily enzyme
MAAPLPDRSCYRLRTLLLRSAGVRVGKGTLVASMPRILAENGFEDLLAVGRNCWFNVGCTLDVHASLTIEDNVYLGQEVLILTHTHQMGSAECRSGPVKAMPVRIGRGAWIGARAIILPGVEVGEGAIVGAGAVVTRNVECHTVVGGVPAVQLRNLDDQTRLANAIGNEVRRDAGTWTWECDNSAARGEARRFV